MHFNQIYVLCLTIGSFNIINVKSLFQGFSIKREFDVSLKPFVWRPISFIKEKFSPFGRFGVRHGIQKRELNLVEPAPVIEHDLHVESAPSVGPFLTPSPVAKPEDLMVSPESIISSTRLVPETFSSPSLLISRPENRPVASFRPGTSFLLPTPVPFESTPPPAVLITPLPVFRPESQNSPIPLSQVASSAPVVNPTSLITQNHVSSAPIEQSLVPNSVTPIANPRPFNYLFNTPVSMSIPPSDAGVGNLLNLSPGLSEVPLIQVSTPLPNAVQSAGFSPDLFSSNMILPSFPSTSSMITNEVLTQGADGGLQQSSGLLNTDIGRVDSINNYLNSVNRQPSKPEVKDMPPLPNNSIVPESSSNSLFGNSTFMRGTRLALHFSNIFVQLLSQFLSNARLTLSQLPELRIRE